MVVCHSIGNDKIYIIIKKKLKARGKKKWNFKLNQRELGERQKYLMLRKLQMQIELIN